MDDRLVAFLTTQGSGCRCQWREGVTTIFAKSDHQYQVMRSVMINLFPIGDWDHVVSVHDRLAVTVGRETVEIKRPVTKYPIIAGRDACSGTNTTIKSSASTQLSSETSSTT